MTKTMVSPQWNKAGAGSMFVSITTSDTYSTCRTWNAQDDRWDYTATRHVYQGMTETLGQYRTERAAKIACQNRAAFR